MANMMDQMNGARAFGVTGRQPRVFAGPSPAVKNLLSRPSRPRKGVKAIAPKAPKVSIPKPSMGMM